MFQEKHINFCVSTVACIRWQCYPFAYCPFFHCLLATAFSTSIADQAISCWMLFITLLLCWSFSSSLGSHGLFIYGGLFGKSETLCYPYRAIRICIVRYEHDDIAMICDIVTIFYYTGILSYYMADMLRILRYGLIFKNINFYLFIYYSLKFLIFYKRCEINSF